MTTPPPPPDDLARERLPVTLLQRRGIEAEVLVPLIRRLERELGPERAHDLARETIAAIAREQGEAVAHALRRDDLDGFGEVRDSWGGAGGDLTIEAVRHDADHLDFNVTRCRFAELYERLGARDLGFVLSCGRDFSLSEGYSDRLHLVRTQTIMQGAAFCDFRYTYAHRDGATETGGDAMTDTPAEDATPEDAPQPAEEPRRSHLKRGTGAGIWRGDGDTNAQSAFTDRVRQATEAARAAAEGRRPAAEQAAREAKERAERAAEAARPHIEQAAQGAANFTKEHRGEIASAALRAARIAARLTVPPHVREAFEAELHRDDPKPPADAGTDGTPKQP